LLDAAAILAAMALWAALIAWRRRKPLLISAASVAALWIGINLWVVAGTHRHRYGRVADVPARQTAIVLGALVYGGGRPSDILADRVDTAADLYLDGRVRKILVSGDHGRHDYDEVNAMRRRLQARGVPAEDIFMDHAGFDTCDTMQRARHVFGVRSAVVVTQAFHLPRAVYLARTCGLDAVGVQSDRRRYRKAVRNHARESLARVKSFAEVHLGIGPRHLGPTIPIEGDGRATWDGAAHADTGEPS
jgi:vancomycin permeability regulator SanA